MNHADTRQDIGLIETARTQSRTPRRGGAENLPLLVAENHPAEKPTKRAKGEAKRYMLAAV